MNKAIAVIGANYGDEGKGLMVDYYSNKNPGAIVVRFNGGAQAGHTVVTPEGKRHVFSHFGSGSFNGATTYLSEYFVANPILFRKEFKELSKFVNPDVIIHPDVIITTPYDMLINIMLEKERGSNNHGTVGVGFGETIERADKYSMLTVGHIGYLARHDRLESFIYTHLNEIRNVYFAKRIKYSSINDIAIILKNDELIYDFINDLKFMIENISISYYDELIYRDVIFEGAQGLMLDMDYGHFPHVTRSNTGMKNVSYILQKINCEYDVIVNYVTRTYTTRHGAGPLEHEDNSIKKLYNIVDETNVDTGYQGKFRFAPFNIQRTAGITEKDFNHYAPNGSKSIDSITCVDQLTDEIQILDNGKVINMTTKAFVNHIMPDMFKYASFGPTREHIVPIGDKN